MIYIHMYTTIDIYVYVDTQTHTHISLYDICIHTYIHTPNTYVYVGVFMHVCVCSALCPNWPEQYKFLHDVPSQVVGVTLFVLLLALLHDLIFARRDIWGQFWNTFGTKLLWAASGNYCGSLYAQMFLDHEGMQQLLWFKGSNTKNGFGS